MAAASRSILGHGTSPTALTHTLRLAGSSRGSADSTTAKNTAIVAAMADEPIAIRTAPRDKRFPSVNQTRHCWSRYLEFHACAKQKGEDDPECEKFKRWYNSICPVEWVSVARDGTVVVESAPFGERACDSGHTRLTPGERVGL